MFGKKGSLDLSGIGKRNLRVGGGTTPGTPMHFARTQTDNYQPSSLQEANQMRRSQQNARMRTLKVAALIICALAISISVGVFVYQQNVKAGLKPTLDETALAEVLSTPEDATNQYWILINKTNAASSEYGRGSIAHLALLYVDGEEEHLSYIEIPTNARIYVDGYGYLSAATIFEMGGEPQLVSSVSTLFGVEISHYFELNEAGAKNLFSTLNLKSARKTAKTDFAAALTTFVEKITSFSSEKITSASTSAINSIATDASATTLATLVTLIQGMNTSKHLNSCQIPASDLEVDEVTFADPATESISTMVSRVESGKSPEPSSAELSSFAAIRAKTSVTIWNGVGVSGIAADCSEILEAAGWQIESVGNAASYVYDETLVVYRDDDDLATAELLIDDLGQGRAIASAARYSFEGDILVVLGQNYQPY